MAGEQPIGNLVVKLSYDGTKFYEGITRTEREIKRLNSTLKGARAETQLYGKGSESATKQLSIMKDAFEQNKRAVDHYQKELQKSKAKLEAFGDTTKLTGEEAKKAEDEHKKLYREIQSSENKIAKSTTAMALLKKEYSELARESILASSKLYSFGKTMETAGAKAQSFGKNMAQVGDDWTRIGAVVGLAGGLLVKSAMDYESAMAGVQKTTNASEADMAKLSTGFREMSKVIPVSSKEFANIGEIAGQLGIKTPAIVEFTEVMAKLGVTTNLSATDGASQFARFANIVGMSQDKFSNLGSAVVELGNNFATTEAEIVDMGMGLAGAGKQIGLSEATIMGMGTALSSLGIASERGGSAMSKVFINMALAVEKGGDELDAFANVAGMSGEAFSKAFKEDASRAIVAFIDGLGQASEKGETAISVLQEMDVSEVRLRDTLIRAGGAHKLFSEAINMSNKAFNENNALNREAEIRFKTTASKVELAKNKLMDVAISAGQQLLPALADAADGIKPVVDGLESAVKWFAGLDDGTKKAIGQFGLFVVAGGPIVSMIGRVITMGGGLLKGAGKLTRHLGEMGSASKIASTTIDGSMLETSKALGLASKAGGVLKAGLMKIGAPAVITSIGSATLAIGAVGLAVGGGIVAFKLWEEHIYKTGQDIERFGVKIDSKVRPQLNDFYKAMGEVNNSVIGLGENTDKPVEAIGTMVDNIKSVAENKTKEIKDSFGKLNPEIQKIIQKSIDKKINSFDGYVTQATEIQNKINEVYNRASEERRGLTDTELSYVEQQTKRLTEIMSGLAAKTEEEQKVIFNNMTANTDKMNQEQLEQRQRYLAGELKSVRDNYKTQKEELGKLLAEGSIDHRDYAKSMEEYSKQNSKSIRDIGIAMFDTLKALNMSEDTIRAQLESMGLSYDDVAKQAEINAINIKNSNEKIAESTGDMTEEARKATEAWNDIVLKDVDGKLKSNAVDFIQEYTKSEEGWNEMRFILQNANIDSNVKDQITQAMILNGKWFELSWEERQANITTNTGVMVSEWLDANQKWTEEVTFEEKMALINSNSSQEIEQVLIDMGIWDTLSPEEKLMLVSTNAGLSVQEAMIAQGTWDTLPFADKKAILTSTAPMVDEDLRKLIGTDKEAQTTLAQKKDANVTTTAPEVQKKIESVQKLFNDWNPGIKKTDLSTNAPSVSSSVTDYRTNLSYVPTLITTELRTRYTSTGARPYAKGTNFHPGGHAILGDGGKREPFLTPRGVLGLSPNKDTLYDLPRGTKVWSSISQFKGDSLAKSLMDKFNIIPHFAQGTRDSFLDNLTLPNMFKGVGNIDNSVVVNIYGEGMVVREDNDIKKIANEVLERLERMKSKNNRKRGD